MTTPEQDEIKKILSGLDPERERLFRINAGQGWTGISRRVKDGVMIWNARPLHAAPEGWPDLVGWTTMKIDETLIGKTVAVFTAVEVKKTGRLSDVQNKFRDVLEKMGGIFKVIK